ncbi:ScbR family autoregulator-binding transcription factor [Curtobacterium pusillum]|uniref:AcrR family transcriptional regulator n=1 Tax=Curtobacterium pusillum TaxID=69373 RepID=A0AAW3T2Z2_9MICO|nr:ScbR family autoregulator-binding transcription factor [Curtobacterium pusillum]MBA8989227.1 AcrR family transcriptional regulator [Curtobacterium pusillum]NUU15449.1 TetR/AcrR family transcriptional regulator [Curtobacterium pusillum]GLK32832.1 TetR family transcriptional regulator [Curtobacterium pusillum]
MAQDGRTRQQRAVATRAAIIDAAAGEFDEHGYLGTSMDAVAERAGLTKGALYFHFTSKADLAGAVIARQHEVSRQYGEAAATRGTTPLEVLMWMSQGLASQMIHEVVVSAGIRLSTDTAAAGVARRNPYTDWMQVAAELVRQGIEAGEIDSAWDPQLIGRVVVPAYTGAQTVSDVLADRADLYDRLRELWTVLLAAIVTDRMRPEIPRLVALIAPLATED